MSDDQHWTEDYKDWIVETTDKDRDEIGDVHELIEDRFAEDMQWPQYFVSGEEAFDDQDDMVPAYFKVDGPNGPVSYVTPSGRPTPTTMYDFAMEAQMDDFRHIFREETPWEEIVDD